MKRTDDRGTNVRAVESACTLVNKSSKPLDGLTGTEAVLLRNFRKLTADDKIRMMAFIELRAVRTMEAATQKGGFHLRVIK
jgi:hypothetical protein